MKTPITVHTSARRQAVVPRSLAPFVLLGLLLAAAATWLAIMHLKEETRHAWLNAYLANEGPIEEAKMPDRHTAAFVPSGVPLTDGESQIYLYVSPTTSRYLASVGGDYAQLLSPWRNFFIDRKLRFTETASLRSVPRRRSSILILPSALALSTEERGLLQAFQRDGGNILATWSLGGMNPEGTWQGHALLQELFGVSVAGELDPASDARFVNLFGDTPLTTGYPAGMRIWIDNSHERALRLTGGNVAARYMDWIRDAAGAPPGAAIVFDEHGAERNHARWVLAGFAETSWGNRTPQWSGFLENALHWLARGTFVSRATWPAPYRAAYLIEMDTEEGFTNAHHFAGMMEAIGARATFYCLTSEAIRFPNLVRHLAKHHEVGYHGDIHVGFRGQPQKLQDERMDQMISQLRSILGDVNLAVGFRAPLEEYDKTTELLLYAKGFRHHTADPNRTDARVPFFSPAGSGIPDEALVVLPRTQHDDISLHAAKRREGAEQALLQALIADFDHALHAGAMGLLSIHSQNMARDSVLYGVMPAFLRHAAAYRDQVWLAAANDIAQWWRERERLRYRISGSSDDFRLDVTIDGKQPLGRGALVIATRAAGAAVELQPALGNRVVPMVKPLDPFRTAIVLDGLAPGTYSWHVKPATVPALWKKPAPAGRRPGIASH